jgi:hypothetical protein
MMVTTMADEEILARHEQLMGELSVADFTDRVREQFPNLAHLDDETLALRPGRARAGR